MDRKEKLNYLYEYCDRTSGGSGCDNCVLNKSEHMWLTPCEDDCNCPNFFETSEYELDKAIKLVQESEELDNVNHPAHYTDGKIEVIDFIEDKQLNFNRGNAIKYISRAGKKDKSKEVEDLQKAVFYINREIKRIKEV